MSQFKGHAGPLASNVCLKYHNVIQTRLKEGHT